VWVFLEVIPAGLPWAALAGRADPGQLALSAAWCPGLGLGRSRLGWRPRSWCPERGPVRLGLAAAVPGLVPSAGPGPPRPVGAGVGRPGPASAGAVLAPGTAAVPGRGARPLPGPSRPGGRGPWCPERGPVRLGWRSGPAGAERGRGARPWCPASAWRRPARPGPPAGRRLMPVRLVLLWIRPMRYERHFSP
jgi:hypothetical protein